METLIKGSRKAVSNWLRQFKTFVDFQTHTYKIQESLLGIFKWGDFEPLPPINYILVFRNVFVKCEGCAIDEFENNPSAYFQVSMVYNNNRRIIVHETRNKEEAFNMAYTLSRELKIRIKDSATDRRQAVWIN